MASKRPKHLNLFKIKQPVPAIVSILHRVSGALLFVLTPLLLIALQRSLTSPESFEALRETLNTPLLKLVVLAVIWSLMHHLFAGLRFLALDLHLGIELLPARKSAMLVLVISLAFTILIGVMIW